VTIAPYGKLVAIRLILTFSMPVAVTVSASGTYVIERPKRFQVDHQRYEAFL
jgi:hypothetical protein